MNQRYLHRPAALLGKAGLLAAAGTLALTACTPTSYFQGSYWHHGVDMSIDASGNGTVTYRTYTWCFFGMTQPCDAVVGNYLYDGGHLTFRLTSPLTSHTATGVVTSGNQVRPGQAVTLTVVRTKNGLPSVVTANGILPWPGPLVYCGSEYVPDCGA